jgi:glycerol-3-phosphate dehydrogenase
VRGSDFGGGVIPGFETVGDGAFDVVVVGGGVTGACIAWESAQRGLHVALVERDDFGAGATANCLKIVHGGLRYLQHLDIRRMRESIAERSAWLRLAPHLVDPLPVLMPTRQGQFPPRWLLAGALAANEVVSFDRNRGMPAGRAIPRARVLSRAECAALLPEAEDRRLTGGVLFHDALMYSPERLTLEVVLAAERAGAVVLNHTEFTGIASSGGRVAAVRLHSRLDGRKAEIRTRWIINATGSSADAVALRMLGHEPRVAHRYSVALNLVTALPARPVAYTLAAGVADPDRVGAVGPRQLFVVPWRGQSLIGTAHLHYSGDPATFEAKDVHLDAFLAELASAAPPLALDPQQIRLIHWGLLPVADSASAHGSGVRLLKRHRVLDHTADGLAGALSVISVKFTTARALARDAVARIIGEGAADPGAARRREGLRLPGAVFESLDALRAELSARVGDVLDAEVVDHLVRSYGSRCTEVVDMASRIPGWSARVVPGAPVIFAQLIYGVQAELARTPEDVICRRTELGPRGVATEAAFAAARKALETVRLPQRQAEPSS